MWKQEVSNAALYVHLDACTKRGIDADQFLVGLPLTMRQLRDLRGRHAWDDHITVHERIVEALGE